MTVLCALTLAGCQDKPDNAEIAVCWAPSTKEMINQLSKQIVSERIHDILVAHGVSAELSKTEQIDGSLTVALSDFYETSVDRVSGSVRCGAQASMDFLNNKGEHLKASSNQIEFAVYQAEAGHMYSIPSRLPLVQMVSDAVASAK